MNNRITVLAFGPVTEVLGSNRLDMEYVQTTKQLTRQLEQNFPGLKKLNYAVAVNKRLVTEVVDLAGGDTVALLPPFSGG